MIDPVFTLDTKYGPVKVTVLDPTPHPDRVRESQRFGGSAQESDLFYLDAESLKINGIAVEVRGSFRRQRRHDKNAENGGEVYAWASYLNVSRVGGGYNSATDNQRHKVHEIAQEALRTITPAQIVAAKYNRRKADAERKRAEAASFREKAAEADAEAAKLEEAAEALNSNEVAAQAAEVPVC